MNKGEFRKNMNGGRSVSVQPWAAGRIREIGPEDGGGPGECEEAETEKGENRWHLEQIRKVDIEKSWNYQHSPGFIRIMSRPK